MMDGSVLNGVKKAAYWIGTVMKSFLLIAGVLTTNAVDIILGGIVMSILLADVTFPVGSFMVTGSMIAWFLSVSFAYVQQLAWIKVYADGKIDKDDIFPLSMAIGVGIGDTFIDASIVLIWAATSPLEQQLSGTTFFGKELYPLLIGVMYALVVVITGFNEYLNSLFTKGVVFDTVSSKPKKQKTKFVPSSNSDSSNMDTARQDLYRENLSRYYDNAPDDRKQAMNERAKKEGFKSFKNKIHVLAQQGKLQPVN